MEREEPEALHIHISLRLETVYLTFFCAPSKQSSGKDNTNEGVEIIHLQQQYMYVNLNLVTDHSAGLGPIQ